MSVTANIQRSENTNNYLALKVILHYWNYKSQNALLLFCSVNQDRRFIKGIAVIFKYISSTGEWLLLKLKSANCKKKYQNDYFFYFNYFRN